jgi:tRNA threonylcarbamoyladenosine biosynthesis protein TsaE
MIHQTLTFHTTSPEETEKLGERIGRALEKGCVVALIGELGAGKTILTRGIAKGLEVPDLVHSPTFTLIHEHQGRLPVYHFDLYRLSSPQELEDLGAESYFYSEGVSVIEWAERAGNALPSDRLEIHITGEDEERTFRICAYGPTSSRVLDKLRAN